MGTKNPIGLGIGNKLDRTLGILVSQRASIGAKWKFPDANFDPLFFGLILSESDTRELGIGVNNSRNHFVVYMTGLAGNSLDARDPLVLGLVRQHWTRNHIANGVNAFDVSPKMFIDFNSFSLVERHSNFLCAQALRVRAASDGNQNLISFELHLFGAFCRSRNHSAIVGIY